MRLLQPTFSFSIMNSNQDSKALPLLSTAHAFGRQGRGPAKGLGALLLLAALAGWPTGLRAQVTLERLEAGSARIWSRTAVSAPISIAPEQQPSVATAAEGGFLVAGENLASGDLFFLHHTNGRTIELTTPPAKTGDLRSGPVLLTDKDRMEGTVWLEGSGPQDFTVLASAWNGSSWETPEIVSVQQTGPQLALSATVLADGTWLVLWAGFDGSDDDIFWSRRIDGNWSEPRRLNIDNQVPDVLPTVTATDEGAHAAWSFFDGNDYRVRIAHWTGNGWSPGAVLEGRGPGQTDFETLGNRAFLTFPTVTPEGWNLIEFADGTTRHTRITNSNRKRPLIVLDENETASLEWPWRSEAQQP